eukprot:1738082-Prymnesium_polylepis.2
MRGLRNVREDQLVHRLRVRLGAHLRHRAPRVHRLAEQLRRLAAACIDERVEIEAEADERLRAVHARAERVRLARLLVLTVESTQVAECGERARVRHHRCRTELAERAQRVVDVLRLESLDERARQRGVGGRWGRCRHIVSEDRERRPHRQFSRGKCSSSRHVWWCSVCM